MSETPAWRVDGWTLAEGFDKIEQQWAAVSEILDDPRLFELGDPGVSGWSCGEHAGHIAMVTLWIARGIERNLEQPDRDVDAPWSEPTGPILEAGEFPRGVAKSPREVDPAGRPREDFVPVLPVAERAWASVREKAELLPDCPARFPHFALGYLTSTEWVRFCAIHSAHHLAVVRDIRAATAG